MKPPEGRLALSHLERCFDAMRKTPGQILRRAGTGLAHWRAGSLWGLSFSVLVLVGVADYLTGYQVSMLIFYLAPVALAAWYVGRAFAVLISFLCVMVWITCDLSSGATYANGAILIWNAAIALGIFLLVGSLLSSLRASMQALENRVQQRTAALTEEMAERQRLEREVLETSEREQRRIGHDLHDGLGQHLTATAFASQVLGHKLSALGQGEASADAERIVELIGEAIELTRSLSRGLSPLAGDAEGLAVSLAELVQQTTAQFYIHCDFQHEASPGYIEPAVATHLYRIAQESIANAVRHGHAGRIVVSLSKEPDGRVGMTIRDNGSGLPPAEQRRAAGQGLRIMAHRAQLIDAELSLGPGLEGGTVVRCVLPASA